MDYKKLRKDLIDYYGIAMFGGFPMAMMDLTKVEKASDDELVVIAVEVGFDLNKYEDWLVWYYIILFWKGYNDYNNLKHIVFFYQLDFLDLG